MEIVKYYKQKHFYDNKEKVATTSINNLYNLYNHNHTIDLLYRTLGIGPMADTDIESLRKQMMEHRSYFTDMYDDWS